MANKSRAKNLLIGRDPNLLDSIDDHFDRMIATANLLCIANEDNVQELADDTVPKAARALYSDLVALRLELSSVLK